MQLREQRSQMMNQNIHIEISLLEFALTILLNQTLVVKNSSKINQMDKQIFFREINNEMVSCASVSILLLTDQFYCHRTTSLRICPRSLNGDRTRYRRWQRHRLAKVRPSISWRGSILNCC